MSLIHPVKRLWLSCLVKLWLDLIKYQNMILVFPEPVDGERLVLTFYKNRKTPRNSERFLENILEEIILLISLLLFCC